MLKVCNETRFEMHPAQHMRIMSMTLLLMFNVFCCNLWTCFLKFQWQKQMRGKIPVQRKQQQLNNFFGPHSCVFNVEFKQISAIRVLFFQWPDISYAHYYNDVFKKDISFLQNTVKMSTFCWALLFCHVRLQYQKKLDKMYLVSSTCIFDYYNLVCRKWDF